MSEPELSFTLEGAEEDGGAVLLNDFRIFIKSITDCLRVVEKRTQGTSELRHQIADMRVGSAYMKLQPALKKKAKSSDSGRVVYSKFESTLSDIDAGRSVDRRFGADDLKEFRKLAAITLNGKKKATVAGIQLSTQFVANVDKLLGGVTKARGTVKGRVEKLNVHDRHEFTLFPPVGDFAITCTFGEELFQKVQLAIKQTVTVHGGLFYRSESPYPERVQVDDIEIHQRDDALPTLSSLRGLMPDATSGKTAAEFVQKIRNE